MMMIFKAIRAVGFSKMFSVNQAMRKVTIDYDKKEDITELQKHKPVEDSK